MKEETKTKEQVSSPVLTPLYLRTGMKRTRISVGVERITEGEEYSSEQEKDSNKKEKLRIKLK